MQRLAMVLLLHETSMGRHYDWLIEAPAPAPGSGIGSLPANLPVSSSSTATYSGHASDDVAEPAPAMAGSHACGTRGFMADDRGLWAARVMLPSWRWGEQARAGRGMMLVALPAHRRRYLHYAGPLTRGRGWVRPVDRGYGIARQWTDRKIKLFIHLQHFTGEVFLTRLGGGQWQAVVRSAIISDKTD